MQPTHGDPERYSPELLGSERLTPELPPLSDLLGELRVVALRLRVPFRGLTVREAALFEGPQGWTEFSPFLEYDDVEASTWLRGAIEYGWEQPPASRREWIPINATVPAIDPDCVGTLLDRYRDPHTVKIKVAQKGQRLDDDLNRVARVRELLPNAKIRVDANGGWSVPEAVTALTALSSFGLEYAEQPVMSTPELADLRVRLGGLVAIAADESIRKASDPAQVASLNAADLIVVKAQPLGGPRRGLKLVSRLGLPAVVSSALDTAVGLTMGAHLAASLASLEYACGLGTSTLFEKDVAELDVEGGHLRLGRITPDASALDHSAASQDRVVHWRDRITRCHAILTSAAD